MKEVLFATGNASKVARFSGKLQEEGIKEKPALKDVKEEIITSLVSEHKSEDTSVQYKALEKMREDAKLKFTDTVLEKKYETYKSQYNK